MDPALLGFLAGVVSGSITLAVAVWWTRARLLDHGRHRPRRPSGDRLSDYAYDDVDLAAYLKSLEPAPDDGCDPDDREQWEKANPPYPHRPPHQFCRRMWESHPDEYRPAVAVSSDGQSVCAECHERSRR